MGKHPETRRQDLALRAFLLGLRDRHGALRHSPGLHDGKHRDRGPSLPRRPRAGRMGRHRQRRAGRRDLQRLEHPALGLGIAGRAFGGLPAGRGTRAGAGRHRQLRRSAERRPRHPLPGRCAHRCRNYLQRHRLGAHAQERRLGGPEPQRHHTGRRGGRADVVLLPVRRGGDGPRQLRGPDARHADALFGDLRLLGRRAAEQLRLQHLRHAPSLRRSARQLPRVLPRLAAHAPRGHAGRRRLVSRNGLQLHRRRQGRGPPSPTRSDRARR